jgi:lysylphosphatidylglycerol synthetase-like protein (DUF2156 family)
VEEREQARQSENQRATLTNIILVIVGAGLAFVADTGVSASTLAFSLPMIAIGAYGAVTTMKYFERWLRHWTRARGYRDQLLELYPEIGEKLHVYRDPRDRTPDAYEKELDRRYPRLRRTQLYVLWTVFHVAVALAGVVLSIVSLVNVIAAVALSLLDLVSAAG